MHLPRDIVHDLLYLQQREFIFGSQLEADEQLFDAEAAIARCDMFEAGSEASIVVSLPEGRVQISVLFTEHAVICFAITLALYSYRPEENLVQDHN